MMYVHDLQIRLSPQSASYRPLTSNLSSTNAKSRKKPAAVTRKCARCSRQRAKFGRFYLSCDRYNPYFQKRKRKDAGFTANFPALQLLHDPQTFGEKLYDLLQRYDTRFSLDHKILIIQLMARVTALHQLSILGFYTYVLKYLTHHQLRAPTILASLAESAHALTPPDVLIPAIRKLAHEFVHPGVGPEVIAAGLNAIREICRRQPWAMEDDLLGDLVAYRKSRDKGVMVAARGLLQLYREVNPAMLKRRERGKLASMGIKDNGPTPFGYVDKPAEDIEGLVVSLFLSVSRIGLGYAPP